MGTSASSKGRGQHQPIVPPWADDDPGKQLPLAPEKRFLAFRRAFGDHIRLGNSADLQKALGHYARTATGGSAVGPRRFGPVYAAGSALYTALSSLGGDGVAAAAQGLSQASLIGQPLDVVCQRLSEVLAPDNGDADRVRQAIDEAMFFVLGDVAFDPTSLDEETVHQILGEYLSQSVFQEIVEEVGGSWANNDAPKTVAAESALLELIRVVVDQNLGPKLNGQINISQDKIHRFLRETIDAVWSEWEAFNE